MIIMIAHDVGLKQTFPPVKKNFPKTPPKRTTVALFVSLQSRSQM